jgi:hypothetical protein
LNVGLIYRSLFIKSMTNVRAILANPYSKVKPIKILHLGPKNNVTTNPDERYWKTSSENGHCYLMI